MENVSSTTPIKRKLFSSPTDQPEAKAAKTMELPGTSSGGNSDPDTGNPSVENAVIPKPISVYGNNTMVFRKNHSFLSYGLAWRMVKANTDGTGYLTTTSLMSIPVDKPWFYMSPSEFKLLLPNTKVKHVRVQIVMRNPRTAFETAASTTTLATMNQNKFFAKGVGLNLKTRGVDRKLIFGSGSEAMINKGAEILDQQTDQKLVEIMYGSATNTTALREGFDFLPYSYLNLPHMNNRYFCLAKSIQNDKTDVSGWYRLNEFIDKEDASFAIGTKVIDYSYEPSMGVLTLPHDYYMNDGYWGSSNSKTNTDLELSDFRNSMNARKLNVDLDAGEIKLSAPNISDIDTDEMKEICNQKLWKSAYYCPIDKNHYIKRGINGMHVPNAQPSVHVGIYPVPRLTTTDLTDKPQHFTDVEVQWDISCELVCESTMEAHLTHYETNHVRPEDAHFVGNHLSTHECFDTSVSTFMGMYTSKKQ